MEKKRIKVWGKIKLFETSCCGIPVYPMAHKSFSLIKALSLIKSDELNTKENQMPEDKPEETPDAPDKPEDKPEDKPAEPDKPEDTPEDKPEDKPDAPEDKPDESEKSISVENMTTILANALTKAINEAEVKRGLVSPEENVEKMQEVLKTKSLGELAIMQGIFKTDQGVGNPVSVEQ